MRLTVFEVVVGVLRSKEFMNDIPKAVETACKVSFYLSRRRTITLWQHKASLEFARLATDALIA